MKWGLLAGGLGAVFMTAIVGIMLTASDTPTSHSFNSAWLFVLFPIGVTVSGALLLAGRDPES